MSLQLLRTFERANDGIAALVQRDVLAFIGKLDPARPEVAKAALFEYMPTLIAQYGDVAAGVAAEWYDEMRAAAGVSGSFRAPLADLVPDDVVNGRLGFATREEGPLYAGSFDVLTDFVALMANQYALQPGRETIMQAAHKENVAYARVPEPGACKFCLMLASRGFVYSKSTAGDTRKFHGKCRCNILPSWDEERARAEYGYDPDALYDMYRSGQSGPARAKAPTPKVKAAKPAPVKMGKVVTDPRGRRQSPLGYVDGKPMSDDVYNETLTARADSDFRFIDASTGKGADDRATGALQYFMETEKAAKQAAKNLASGKLALDGVDLSEANFLLTDGYEIGDLQDDITAAATKLTEWDANRVPLGKVYKGIQFDQDSTIEDVRRGLLTKGLNFTSVTPDRELAEKYAGRPWRTRSVVLEIDGAEGIKLNSVGDHAIKSESLYSGDLEILDITEVDERFIVKARAK